MDRLTTMEAFVRTVEAGSFSAAARQMRIGQPAISKSIAALEKRLGVCLLMRSTRSLTLTAAGRHFYHHAQRAIQEVHEADNAACGEGNGFAGRLRVAAGDPASPSKHPRASRAARHERVGRRTAVLV